MSKLGHRIQEMQEDAETMTLQEFTEKHGAVNADLWAKLQEPKPDYVYPGQDAQT